MKPQIVLNSITQNITAPKRIACMKNVSFEATVADCLVCGFLRHEEDNLCLFMAIPNGIYNLIVGFYPKLMRFEHFSPGHHTSLNDGYEIKGNGDDCGGFLVYPETTYPEGYRKGIHYWSVKLLSPGRCYRSIGVVSGSKRHLDALEVPHHYWPNEWMENGDICTDLCCSDDGYDIEFEYPVVDEDFHWKEGDVMTVKLDCDNDIVSYFKNDLKARSNAIEKDKAYFFVLLTCDAGHDCFIEDEDDDDRNWSRVVETPLKITC